VVVVEVGAKVRIPMMVISLWEVEDLDRGKRISHLKRTMIGKRRGLGRG
jgi:hypothetical protein